MMSNNNNNNNNNRVLPLNKLVKMGGVTMEMLRLLCNFVDCKQYESDLKWVSFHKSTASAPQQWDHGRKRDNQHYDNPEHRFQAFLDCLVRATTTGGKKGCCYCLPVLYTYHFLQCSGQEYFTEGS
eukprot:scaffold1374_cov175-Amphora_coffeaeformis.AAC.15